MMKKLRTTGKRGRGTASTVGEVGGRADSLQALAAATKKARANPRSLLSRTEGPLIHGLHFFQARIGILALHLLPTSPFSLLDRESVPVTDRFGDIVAVQ
jgi:hypothetical protein